MQIHTYTGHSDQLQLQGACKNGKNSLLGGGWHRKCVWNVNVEEEKGKWAAWSREKKVRREGERDYVKEGEVSERENERERQTDRRRSEKRFACQVVIGLSSVRTCTQLSCSVRSAAAYVCMQLLFLLCAANLNQQTLHLFEICIVICMYQCVLVSFVRLLLFMPKITHVSKYTVCMVFDHLQLWCHRASHCLYPDWSIEHDGNHASICHTASPIQSTLFTTAPSFFMLFLFNLITPPPPPSSLTLYSHTH